VPANCQTSRTPPRTSRLNVTSPLKDFVADIAAQVVHEQVQRHCAHEVAVCACVCVCVCVLSTGISCMYTHAYTVFVCVCVCVCVEWQCGRRRRRRRRRRYSTTIDGSSHITRTYVYKRPTLVSKET